MAQDEKKRQSFIQPKKNKKNVSVSYKYSGAAILSGIQLDSTYEKIQQTVVKLQAPWWLVGPQMATHIVGCGGRVGRAYHDRDSRALPPPAHATHAPHVHAPRGGARRDHCSTPTPRRRQGGPRRGRVVF